MWKLTALVCLMLVALVGTLQQPVRAEEGEAIFTSLKCGLCHKPDKKGAGPSLKEITQAYAEKEDNLVQYLKGEAEPLIDLGKASVMKSPISKTKELSPSDTKALADYMLSFK